MESLLSMPVSVIIVVIVTQGDRFFNDGKQMLDKEKTS
jgi:hypothetical protein